MKKTRKDRCLSVAIGLLLLMFGLLYYLLFRNPTSLYLWYFPGIRWLTQVTSDINPVNYFSGFDSLPSFLHVLAMSYLSLGLIKLGRNVVLIIPAFWLLVNLLFELGQRYPNEVLFFIPESEGFWLLHHYFLNGVFDWGDIFASLLAFLIISFHMIINMKHSLSLNFSCLKHPVFTHVVGSCVFVIGIGSLMGTSVGCGTSDDSRRCPQYSSHDPVYLSYEELRRPVTTNNEQTLEDMGKIYLYQKYLFVNSRNNGVHVYDNQDATNPIHLSFINVPGNIDIAIKDGYLYLDSYIDLVVVDISDVQNIREVYRIEDVFPYNPRQNLPEDIYLSHYDIKKGVVIGYKGEQQ